MAGIKTQSFGNTGAGLCPVAPSVPTSTYVVPTYDSTGALNVINCNTETINDAYIAAKINEPDPSKRWYPITKLENVVVEKADTAVETAPSGTIKKIREGIRSMTAEKWDTGLEYAGRLSSANCSAFSVFVIDDCSRPVGYSVNEGILRPLPVIGDSWDAIFQLATDTTGFKVNISFQFDRSISEATWRMIEDDLILTNLNNVDGLVDVKGDGLTSVTATTFTIDVLAITGNTKSTPVEGKVTADFELTNLTTGATITITSATETSAGTYDFVIPSQTSAHVLSLSLDKTSSANDGQDGFVLSQTAITIP
jgi:hypothetical protein